MLDILTGPLSFNSISKRFCATFLLVPLSVLFSLGCFEFTSVSASPPGLTLSLFLRVLQAQSTHRRPAPRGLGAEVGQGEAKLASYTGLSQASSDRNGHGGRQQNPSLQTSQSHNGDGTWTHLLVQQWCRDWVLLYSIHLGNARSPKPSRSSPSIASIHERMSSSYTLQYAKFH